VQRTCLDRDRNWWHLLSGLCRAGELEILAGGWGDDELTTLVPESYIRGWVRNICILVNAKEASQLCATHIKSICRF
jgi:hypothetical protein